MNPRRSPLIPAVVLLACVLAERLDAAPRAEYSRLRCLDEISKGVLKLAAERSATVRRLAERIEESDLVVYIRSAAVEGNLAGTTTLLSTTSRSRFLVVTIDPRCPPLDRLPRLAHELRHAVEMADAREVRDEAGMRALFQRIGWRSGHLDRWETREAVETGRRVANEIWKRPTPEGILAQRRDGAAPR